MSDTKKPKSSIAENFTAVASVLNTKIAYENFKLNAAGYSSIIKSIYDTSNEISNKQNLQSTLLAKQLEVQSKLVDIDYSLKTQVKISKKIEANQRILIESQNRQNILLQKQVLLNEEQVIIQQHSLIAQELQAKIAQKNDIERQKQKELKNIVFSFDGVIKEIARKENNVTKFILTEQLKKDIEKNKINPNELEEISDKQFANQVFDTFNQLQIITYESLTEIEKNDIDFFNNYMEKVKTLNQVINDNNSKLKSIIKNINYCNDKSDIVKRKIFNHNNRIQYLEKEIIINKDKKEYNIKLPLFISFLLTILFLVNILLMYNYKDNFEISPYSALLLVSVIFSFIITFILIYKNPKKIIKRNNGKILYSQNAIKNLNINEQKINKDREEFSLKLSNERNKNKEKETELSTLNIKMSDFYNKYPDIKNLMLSLDNINGIKSSLNEITNFSSYSDGQSDSTSDGWIP